MRSYQQSGPAGGGAEPTYRGSGDGNAPGSGANAGSFGRGRSATQPAWMTQGVGQTAVAPGSSPTGVAYGERFLLVTCCAAGNDR